MLKKVYIIILALICAWFTTKALAGYQTIKVLNACGAELNISNRLKNAKSEVEYRNALISLIDCIEPKIPFPATLYYSREQSIASIKTKRSTP